MINTITIIYFFYMFIVLYFLFLFSLTFLQNKKEMFSSPEITKEYSISVLIPAHNEERTIRSTVEGVLNSDYKNIVEIIIITNACTDNSLKIARELSKKHKIVKCLNSEVPSKANALNEAYKIAKGELVAVVDADSYPDKNALSSMVGFFDDWKVGAVTTRVLVKHRNNFLRKMQAVEYKVIAFTRRLLGFLDSIYVTPGPLALYRKKALEDIGGFDTKNMTEDIEATWHVIHEGYKVRMSFVSKVTTVAPSKFRDWFTQRVRWNIGGIQTILKYKNCFLKKGMLGFFILPLFTFSLLLSIFGLGFFLYRFSRSFLVKYLSVKYSLEAQTAVLLLEDLAFSPSILNFFGIILFALGMSFVLYALYYVNRHIGEKESFFIVVFYSIIYILLRPIVLVTGLYKLARGKYSWR
ncbi:MAG: glycosyltransferase [Candidatus Pacearchaeota archaeon]